MWSESSELGGKRGSSGRGDEELNVGGRARLK